MLLDAVGTPRETPAIASRRLNKKGTPDFVEGVLGETISDALVGEDGNGDRCELVL